MSTKSIFGNPSYINFQFPLVSFSVAIAIYPLIYILPTTWVIYKTTKVFLLDTWNKRTRVGLDPQMFLVITLSHVLVS